MIDFLDELMLQIAGLSGTEIGLFAAAIVCVNAISHGLEVRHYRRHSMRLDELSQKAYELADFSIVQVMPSCLARNRIRINLSAARLAKEAQL